MELGYGALRLGNGMRKSQADPPEDPSDSALAANLHMLEHLRCARLLAEQQQLTVTTYLIDLALASRKSK